MSQLAGRTKQTGLDDSLRQEERFENPGKNLYCLHLAAAYGQAKACVEYKSTTPTLHQESFY
jgi:hypothetical protein